MKNPVLARLKGAGPVALATTFVVGGTVEVINTYFPEVSAFMDVHGAVTGVVSGILAGGAVAVTKAVKRKRREAARLPQK